MMFTLPLMIATALAPLLLLRVLIFTLLPLLFMFVFQNLSTRNGFWAIALTLTLSSFSLLSTFRS